MFVLRQRDSIRYACLLFGARKDLVRDDSTILVAVNLDEISHSYFLTKFIIP